MPRKKKESPLEIAQLDLPGKSELRFDHGTYYVHWENEPSENRWDVFISGPRAKSADKAVRLWNKRAERTWVDETGNS